MNDSPKETRGDRRWRETLEGRRAQIENFTWAVPGLAVAGQAFLLAIVLRPEMTALARVVAAAAGLMAAVAALHLYAKQLYLFDLYESSLESQRQRLGHPGLQLDELRELNHPSNTLYVQRKWERRWMLKQLVVERRTAITWLAALAAFVAIDFLLLAYAIVALAGADPGWLGPRPLEPTPESPSSRA